MVKSKKGKGLKKLEKQEKQKNRAKLLQRLAQSKAPPEIKSSLARTTRLGLVSIPPFCTPLFSLFLERFTEREKGDTLTG